MFRHVGGDRLSGPSGRRDRLSDTREHALFAGQESIQRLPQIPHQVKAVGDLDSLWRALADAVGKRSTTIPTHHLDLGAPARGQPRGQPRGPGCRRAVWQQVNDALLFKVHQQCAVAQPTPEGEIIHAEETQVWGTLAGAGEVGPADEAQERIAARPTGSQLQPSREAPSRLATQRETDRFEVAL